MKSEARRIACRDAQRRYRKRHAHAIKLTEALDLPMRLAREIIAQQKGKIAMCDFSIQQAKSRPAVVGDKLVVTDFGVGTRGFSEVDGDSSIAVCVMPGTEIAFDGEVERREFYDVSPAALLPPVAVFRQINKDNALTHHDALEFPGGEVVLLTLLVTGQKATVLQLPAAPKNEAEAGEQKRLEVVG